MQQFGAMFGFLVDLTKLLEMEKTDLQRQCTRLSDALSTSESQEELRILWEIIPKETTTALKTLCYLKEIEGTFPNCEIELRILLTFPVTVASGERSFSKLKPIKNYLCTSMSQDRLCRLALLSIEKDIASKLDYKDLMLSLRLRRQRKWLWHHQFLHNLRISLVRVTVQ